MANRNRAIADHQPANSCEPLVVGFSVDCLWNGSNFEQILSEAWPGQSVWMIKSKLEIESEETEVLARSTRRRLFTLECMAASRTLLGRSAFEDASILLACRQTRAYNQSSDWIHQLESRCSINYLECSFNADFRVFFRVFAKWWGLSNDFSGWSSAVQSEDTQIELNCNRRSARLII